MSNRDGNQDCSGGWWGSVVVTLADGTVLRSQSEAEAYADLHNPGWRGTANSPDPDVEALAELEGAELASTGKAAKRARGRKAR